MRKEFRETISRSLKISLFFIITVVIPVSSLFLIFAYVQPCIQNFLTLPIQSISALYLIKYIALFTVSSILIGMYFYLALYHENSEIQFLEKLSYPLVTSFVILAGFRFLKYFMSAEPHRQLSIFISEFAVLLPTVAVAKIVYSVLTDEENHVEFLAGISQPGFDKKEIAKNIVLVPIFGFVAAISENIILSNIPKLIFVLIGPLLIVLAIAAIYSLKDPKFKSWINNLVDDTSS